MQKKNNKKNGYTIIETMIAVSIFLIVVMIAMGALLSANLVHQKSRDMRSIMDNLSFIMEDMSRNLRTGYDYHCVDDGDFNETDPHSCISGEGISFISASSLRWMYKIATPDGGATFNISKFSDAGANWVQLNPEEVVLTSLSEFSVLGAEDSSLDEQQPLVIIKLVGRITYKNNITSFALQTSVSQRLVDL